MIFEKLWEFSDHQVLVSGTTAISTNIVDWTTSNYDEWVNTEIPLWLVVTVNTVFTGTSTKVMVYQHSTTTITSGDLLMTGRDVVAADVSANPRDPGHFLFCVPVMSCLSSIQTADRDRYFGLVYGCTGNCSDGYVDAFILASAQPPIPTTQIVTSNV